jgi:hypothetical protein
MPWSKCLSDALICFVPPELGDAPALKLIDLGKGRGIAEDLSHE